MAKKKKAKLPAQPLQVDIVSDVVCPWCWLGYRLFEKAARQSKNDIQITWRPYMLDPSIPEGGADYKTYMKDKFGDSPSDRFKAMRTMLEDKGPELGIDFQFGNISRRPNTLNAHRLIKWAQNNEDAGTEAAERLFKAFFTDGDDIGNIDVLGQIAEEIGLEPDLTKDLLNTDRDANAVREEIMFFRNLGISGVPTFIYNGQVALQGAQDPSTHLDAMKKALELGFAQDD